MHGTYIKREKKIKFVFAVLRSTLMVANIRFSNLHEFPSTYNSSKASLTGSYWKLSQVLQHKWHSCTNSSCFRRNFNDYRSIWIIFVANSMICYFILIQLVFDIGFFDFAQFMSLNNKVFSFTFGFPLWKSSTYLVSYYLWLVKICSRS